MRYFLTTIIVSLIFVSNILAQDYAVQVAAYSDPVTLERFEDLPGVYQEQDHNNIYRYYLGPYVTEDFAEKVKKKALKAGFPYSRVVNLTQIRELCKRSCASPEDAIFIGEGEGTPAPESNLFIRNILVQSEVPDSIKSLIDDVYECLADLNLTLLHLVRTEI